ncbi:unnamed protein product [Microthlaspi erraticum]|uniref:Uncharacterized protein n=1 Tax=Microthlaspi erraticum TaxID=1685480 RepID=A0A6D2HI89_9BRAS|nr:unnamed protein product [Microthlaspi erraticum]
MEGIAMSKFGTREEDSPSSSGENENKKISFSSLMLLIPLPKATISRVVALRRERRRNGRILGSGLWKTTSSTHIGNSKETWQAICSVYPALDQGANLMYLSLCLSHE